MWQNEFQLIIKFESIGVQHICLMWDKERYKTLENLILYLNIQKLLCPCLREEYISFDVKKLVTHQNSNLEL